MFLSLPLHENSNPTLRGGIMNLVPKFFVGIANSSLPYFRFGSISFTYSISSLEKSEKVTILE